MGARGFEPRTSPLSGVRSSRLSTQVHAYTTDAILVLESGYGEPRASANLAKSHRSPRYFRPSQVGKPDIRRRRSCQRLAGPGRGALKPRPGVDGDASELRKSGGSEG